MSPTKVCILAILRHIKLPECFHQRCIQTIFNIKLIELVLNSNILDKVNICCIETLLIKSHPRWVGKKNMQDYRLPKIALSLLAVALKYEHLMKGIEISKNNSLGTCKIDRHKIVETALDRVIWKQKIH